MVRTSEGPFGVMPCHCREHEGRVSHRTRQRTHVVEAPAQGYDAARADKAIAGLQSHNATVGGWDAHGSAGIRAKRRRTQTGGNCCPRAAARTAGRIAVPKWICRAAMVRVVVDGAERPLLHVELA